MGKLAKLGLALIVLFLLFLGFAWIDGGRETQQMIETSVEIPATPMEPSR